MKCPSCQEELRIADRQGVEIDYCPACRGVWLDRGELDKLIERSQTEPRYERENRAQQSRSEEANRGYSPPKKRESFLSQLFDFD